MILILAKYNRSGILQWFLRKGSTAKDIYNDFVVRNNVIYATGYFTNQIIFNNDTLRTSSSLNSDAFVAAFNEIGNPISGVSIVGTGNYEDAGTIVNMDANSRAYVSGYYQISTNPNWQPNIYQQQHQQKRPVLRHLPATLQSRNYRAATGFVPWP